MEKAGMAEQYEILEDYKQTSKYIDQVRSAADSDKSALGFLAFSVYEQFASKGGLYVLTGDDEYAGHLLFDRRFPRAHVRQIFVSPKHRGRGLARKLLARLKDVLSREDYISVYARVAEDLKTANAFWQSESFYIQRTERGGETTNRQILVRCHELDSPQLFPRSGVSDKNPLGLDLPSPEDLPIFLLDMNVLFDINPRRLRREAVIGLFQAERMNICRLAISTEIRSELERTALKERQTDPMAAYLEIFACFPVAEDGVEELIEELTGLIFPAQNPQSLSPNQRSDLRHVITAIRNSLTGLITSDVAILSAAAAIEEIFGVHVLSPEAFQLTDSALRDGAYEISSEHSLLCEQVGINQESSVRGLLTRLGISGSAIASGWLPPETKGNIASRLGVWFGDDCLGFATWPAWSHSGMVNVRAAIDESHSAAIDAARALLMQVTRRVASSGPIRIRLDLPKRQSNLRELALGVGFRSPGHGESLVKTTLGRVVTADNWPSLQKELADAGGPRLSAKPPVFRDIDQQIELLTPDGNKVHVSIDQLETLLAPAILCLPGRRAVITPVRREFSEMLLGHSPQTSFLPESSAALFNDKHFFSSPQSIKHLKRGTLVLFYESQKNGGAAGIVAIARVRQAYLKRCDSLTVSDYRPSVLDEQRLAGIGVSEEKTVTVFDNVFPLKGVIPLAFLKTIGCGRPNDVITTRPLSKEQLDKIVREAFS